MSGEITIQPTNVAACPHRIVRAMHIKLMLRREREEFLDVVLTPALARQVVEALESELAELSNTEPAPF